MKVLYVDITSPIGHKNYNYKILSLLSELAEIDVAFKKDYLQKFNVDYVNKIYDIPDKFFSENLQEKKSSKLYKLIYRYYIFKSMQWVNSIIKQGNYDIVFFSSIEVISFSLGALKPKTRYCFVDHAIADLDRNKVKQFFWKHINHKIDAIVMENYIGDFLKDKLKIKNNIWILKHPLPKIEYNECLQTKKDKMAKYIFAPSGSNDEKFVQYLIDNDNLIPNFKIVIKSKNINYKSDKLHVFNNRISDDEYYNLMLNCSFILLPYDDSYNYRVSGVFFEAIEFGKLVLLNANNSLSYYVEKYPNTVFGYNGYENFMNLLEKMKELTANNNEICKIKEEYSDSVLQSQLKSIIQFEEKK